MTNFSWRHKERHFVMFVYGGAVQIIPHANVGVSFFGSLFSKNNWRKLYCSNRSHFKIIVVVTIYFLFKLTLCIAKMHFFGLKCS